MRFSRSIRRTSLAERLAACALIAGGLVLTSCSLDSETIQEAAGSLGALERFLVDEQTENWTAKKSNGTFVLSNHTDPSSVRRIALDIDESLNGQREVSVDVSVANRTAASRAGLVFGVRPNAKNYYIYVLEADRKIALYHRTERGQIELLKVQNESIGPGFTRLGIREDGTRLSFLVNGELVGAYDLSAPDRGAPGILAWGTGDFTFTNFRHSPDIPSPMDQDVTPAPG